MGIWLRRSGVGNTLNFGLIGDIHVIFTCFFFTWFKYCWLSWYCCGFWDPWEFSLLYYLHPQLWQEGANLVVLSPYAHARRQRNTNNGGDTRLKESDAETSLWIFFNNQICRVKSKEFSSQQYLVKKEFSHVRSRLTTQPVDFYKNHTLLI